jgi:hypothetical protein
MILWIGQGHTARYYGTLEFQADREACFVSFIRALRQIYRAKFENAIVSNYAPKEASRIGLAAAKVDRGLSG